MNRKTNDMYRVVMITSFGIIIGIMLGVSISLYSLSKLYRGSRNYVSEDLVPKVDRQLKDKIDVQIKDKCSNQNQTTYNPPTELVYSNPQGAERLPEWIIHSQSDLYLRRLWGLPSEDLPEVVPKYLVTFTVGYELMHNIDAAVKKFSDNFTILLFHYDGRVNEWDQFEWSNRTIHISAPKQTKWWFTKRFLHPDIVAPYDYIFIWDEDLGLENFDGEKYIELVKKYGLEISQPALDPSTGATWDISLKRDDQEVHKELIIKPDWCRNPLQPPCAGFVEIMAPVFSREAYRCVWHLIQNDLVHGWGLDFALQKCVETPYEKIGVVDAQWILHKRVPTLTNQGEMSSDIDSTGEAVKARCEREWKVFKSRLHDAELHEKQISGSS